MSETMTVQIDNSGRFIQVCIPEGSSREQAALICLSAASAVWARETLSDAAALADGGEAVQLGTPGRTQNDV